MIRMTENDDTCSYFTQVVRVQNTKKMLTQSFGIIFCMYKVLKKYLIATSPSEASMLTYMHVHFWIYAVVSYGFRSYSQNHRQFAKEF